MKAADVLKELETIAEKKAIAVSYENLAAEMGTGGLCKVKGFYRVIVDRRATDGDKVNVLAQALARFPLEDVFMSEFTRQVVNRVLKKMAASSRPATSAAESSEPAAVPTQNLDAAVTNAAENDSAPKPPFSNEPSN